jgi:hypothetical protein
MRSRITSYYPMPHERPGGGHWVMPLHDGARPVPVLDPVTEYVETLHPVYLGLWQWQYAAVCCGPAAPYPALP